MNNLNTSKIDLRDIECFLLDMDGTIYHDCEIIDGTLDFLAELKKQNKRAFYITNNSSKTATEYVNKLSKMNIPASESDFFTSADALVNFLEKKNTSKKAFILGTPAYERYMEKKGYTLVREYTTDPDKRPDFVILAFDTGLTYEKLRIACDYITDGVCYVATHPDMVCPVSGGRTIPDAGSFMLLIEGATGKRPELIAGKPDPCMINTICELTGIPKEKVAVVGDRLYTDIMSGINAGVTTVCVLTGEATEEDIKSFSKTPDYVLGSIKDIFELIKT